MTRPLDVVVVLGPSLLHGRTKLGQKVQTLCEQRPQVLEQRAKDGTLRCPAIRLAASEGQLAAGHDGREVKWRVGGVPARHIMLCLTPQEFVRAFDADGLSTLMHAAEAAHPGYRLHFLTWDAISKCVPAAADAAGSSSRSMAAAEGMRERLWQVVADLAVWRPDVAVCNATSVDEAAQHVWRVTRAVAEEGYKSTGTHSYLSVLPDSALAQDKRQRLEALLTKYGIPRDGSQAALMRAQLAIPGVSAEAAYATAVQFGSLQGLLEAAERDATQVQAVIAGLPLPASRVVVGPSAAEKVVAALGWPNP